MASMNKNIFLVGLMGSGKTTVGKILAKRLGLVFIDSDQEIEARTGASISWIFEIEGEASFRKREEEAIADLTKKKGLVLATGGGTVISPHNRKALKENGTVVYLRASVEHILQRTMHDKTRPLLQTENPRQKIEELAKQREGFYQEVADIIVDTGKQNVHAMVQSLVSKIEKFNRPKGRKTPKSRSPYSMRKTKDIHLKVDLGKRSYPIEIGPNLLTNKTLLAKCIRSEKVAIVTNTIVAPLYLEKLQKTLEVVGKKVISIILPDGESEKNWGSLMKIFDCLLEHQCDRKTTLLALGGGVIGDLTGYAAASFMRGVPFVQIPTTLLAEVDSSVGGKTGINHPLGKNMIGAFYQPEAVIADTETLKTLPDRELSAGMAEVIKHGAILDVNYFTWLEQNIEKILNHDAAALAHTISRSCEIKADVVKKDEKESTGLRAILNFGHTFGHAIEAGMGFGTWLHGEAVGCGMVLAADLSCRMGYLDLESKERIEKLVAAAKLPTKPPQMDAEKWISLMKVDKKNAGGEIKFVLLKGLGKTIVTTVPENLLRETLANA